MKTAKLLGFSAVRCMDDDEFDDEDFDEVDDLDEEEEDEEEDGPY